MKYKIVGLLAAAHLALAATPGHAIPLGDLTSGGMLTVSDVLTDGEAWAVENGLGINFYTIDLGPSARLTIDLTSAINLGISLFEGTIGTDFIGSFNNNGDYTYFDTTTFQDVTASYVAGTNPFGGPFNSFETTLADAGTYSLAIGGAGGLIFAPEPFAIAVKAVNVPLASTALLFTPALAGLFAVGRRKPKC